MSSRYTRKHSKPDANQAAIVDAMRRAGAVVGNVSEVANLGYDLVIAYRGAMRVIEIKDGDKPPSAQRLTESELRAQLEYGRHYAVVRSVDEALDLLRGMG